MISLVQSQLIVFFISIIASIYFNKIVHKVYLKNNMVDQINQRSSHSVTATRSGGVSIFISLIVILLIYSLIYQLEYNMFIWLALSLSLFLGFWDDLYDISYKHKFIVQIFIGFLLTQSGYLINNFHGVFGLYEIPYWASMVTSIFVYLVITNAVNLIDGIDGLLSMTGLYVLSIFSLLFWVRSAELFSLAVPLMGIIAGFLYHNLKPFGKVFLGDAGSLTMGTLFSFFVFWLMDGNNIQFTDTIINRSLLAVLIFIYPLADTLRVFILRASKGKSPFSPDRSHLHHRLIDKGYTHFFSSIQIIVLSALLLALNLILYSTLGLIGATLMSSLYIVIIYYVRFK
jgi:UDP-GlcNAc:undecaprenyl-phosphate GlcNAc-1-phosphate transferase